jgi:zinc transporter, ZIP family
VTASLVTAALAISAPVIAMAGAGLLAAIRPPGASVRSAIQHFAAGILFYIVAAELLPGAQHVDAGQVANPLPIGIAFAVGVATMFALRRFTSAKEETGITSISPASSTTIAPVGSPVVSEGISVPALAGQVVEGLFDGLLLGLGLAADSRIGVLLAMAMTLEHFSLGLAAAVGLLRRGVSRGGTISITAGLSLAFVVGAVTGGTALQGLSGIQLAIGMAFASAAVLFFVTEELLVEAHESGVTDWGVATFFAGFLALMMLDLTLPA